ncbi:MAG: S-layer family protein, partial [Moorea sp. SIO3C2]|nr:S-layer family protein [Moorena sp. SIO3C2]
APPTPQETPICTDRLRVTNGGFISSQTDGSGEAGNIQIFANSIEVSGRRILRSATEEFGVTPSQIAASSSTGFTAGSVLLDTDSLQVSNNGEITVSNRGTGDAGNLDVAAGTVFLTDGGRLRAEVSGGNQGNIRLNSQELLALQGGSAITTNATGASTGGNISLISPFIVGFNNSDIVANAVDGNGGNIAITAQGLLGLEFSDRLTPNSDITASSQFGINGTVEINDFTTDPDSGLVELPSGLVDASTQIAKGCASNQGNTFIATGRGGFAASPTELVDRDRPWIDTRDLSAFLNHTSEHQMAKPIELPITIEPLQEATGMAIAPDGTLQLVASHAQDVIPQASCTSQTNIL